MTGCAATDLLSLAKPSGGISTEIVAGDKEETLQLGNRSVVENTAEQVGDRVENQEVVNYVQNLPMEYLWVLVLAIMLPSPGETGRMLWNGFLTLIGRKKND